MLKMYLACLIFGGIFIAVTLLFGGDTDMDADVGDMDFDVDAGVEAGGEVDMGADADVDVNGEGLTAAIKFLSFRNIVFFLAFFGLTGTVLTFMNSPSLLTFPVAVGMGLGAATLMHRVLSHLMKNEVGHALNIDQVAGLPARVTVHVGKNRRGKVVLEAGGQRLQLLALTADEATREEIPAGETVYILRVRDGVAYVVEETFINTP